MSESFGYRGRPIQAWQISPSLSNRICEISFLNEPRPSRYGTVKAATIYSSSRIRRLVPWTMRLPMGSQANFPVAFLMQYAGRSYPDGGFSRGAFDWGCFAAS